MRIFLAVLFLFSVLMPVTEAQHAHPTYIRAKIDLSYKSLRELARVGIDVTHGKYVKDKSFTATFGDWELKRIKENGFSYSVEIPDVQKYYAQRNSGQIETRSAQCEDVELNYPKPLNFELGSMGGFFTYAQMLDHLDAMVFTYPNLITNRQDISDIQTHMGNRLFYVKISDQPNTNEPEPKVLYTALHHAREPISLSQMIYYMWYLLENYETDPEVRDILNETELFFIPCVNPDGYQKNYETHPDGGGMWRKNLRDNNNDGHHHIQTDGVDINRNYGFKWGYDNDGSATNFEAETYRGTEAFSEPETRAMREFVSNNTFDFAFNYHSYGNILLYPWGYDEVVNDQKEIYENLSDLLTRENKFGYGTSNSELGYFSNGDANDWMYGDDTKPATLTFTPEVGSEEDDFYPARDRIIGLCKETMRMNLLLAKLPHAFGLVVDATNTTLTEKANDLNFGIQNYGVSNANFDVAIEPFTDHVEWYTTQSKTASLTSLSKLDMSFSYQLKEETPYGSRIGFTVKANNGHVTEIDTIYKLYAPGGDVVFEEGNALNNWSRPGQSNWAITSEDAYQGPTSFTDSPNGNYDKNEESIIQLKQEIDLTDASDGFIEFWAKWAIDPFLDYVVFQASADNGPWTNLCGLYTTEQSVFQQQGIPLYDGIQEEWVREHVSLEDFIGQKVKLRFMLITNDWLEFDGFYFDDLMVTVLEDNTTSFEPVEKDGFLFETVRPNPAQNVAHFPVTLLPQNNTKNVRLVVTDLLGRQLIEQSVQPEIGRQIVHLDVRQLNSGTYFCSLLSDKGIVATQTLIVE